jgi:ubiquitin
MLIYIWMQTGKIIFLIVKQSDTILSVKRKIHAVEGIPPDSHRLWYDGKELDNGCTLNHYKIQEESKIYSAPDGVEGKSKFFSRF